MEDHLGAVAPPSHPGSVEAHADEVAYGPLDDAGADVEILPTQPVILHSLSVLPEVADSLVEDESSVLVAGSGASGRGEGGVERRFRVSGGSTPPTDDVRR